MVRCYAQLKNIILSLRKFRFCGYLPGSQGPLFIVWLGHILKKNRNSTKKLYNANFFSMACFQGKGKLCIKTQRVSLLSQGHVFTQFILLQALSFRQNCRHSCVMGVWSFPVLLGAARVDLKILFSLFLVNPSSHKFLVVLRKGFGLGVLNTTGIICPLFA